MGCSLSLATQTTMRALAVILLSASLAQGSILRQAAEPDTTVKPETTTEGDKPITDKPAGPLVCPAGNRGSGGECSCDSVPGWDGSVKDGGSWTAHGVSREPAMPDRVPRRAWLTMALT